MRYPRTLSFLAPVRRALPACAMSVALTVCGGASAYAAASGPQSAPGPVGPVAPTGHLQPGTTTLPAQELHRITRMLHQGDTDQATTTSTNWSGYYEADTGPYTTVSSSWTEPKVSCTTNGIIGFWIGLDGFNSNTVEQDGTLVDCSTGSPQHVAWWETYPANSVQEYSDPVAVGDHLSSTVTSLGSGRYQMVLSDSSQGWTENHTVSANGDNASAEIITEAVSEGSTITPLPNFGSVSFTGSTIDNDSLQSEEAQPIDMTNSSGQVIATTGPDDSSGDFTVYYGSSVPSGNTVTVTSPGNQSTAVNTGVSLQIRATDSGGASLTYSATGLPSGLSINSTTGLISGTTAGTASSNSVKVTATDTTGAFGSASFTWTVTSGSTPPPSCSGLTAWSSTKFYTPGNKVSYNGVKYTAIWFSRGAVPSAASSRYVWANNGAC